MNHLSDDDIIRLVGDELPSEERRQIEAHIECCEQCRLRHNAVSSVDSLLDEWAVDTAGRDMLGQIRSRLTEEKRPCRLPYGLPSRRDRFRQVGRIAAAIIIGIGLGHTVGRLAKTPAPLAPTVVATASDQDVADEIGLYILESPASAGLFTTVLDITEAENGEGERR